MLNSGWQIIKKWASKITDSYFQFRLELRVDMMTQLPEHFLSTETVYMSA